MLKHVFESFCLCLCIFDHFLQWKNRKICNLPAKIQNDTKWPKNTLKHVFWSLVLDWIVSQRFENFEEICPPMKFFLTSTTNITIYRSPLPQTIVWHAAILIFGEYGAVSQKFFKGSIGLILFWSSTHGYFKTSEYVPDRLKGSV